MIYDEDSWFSQAEDEQQVDTTFDSDNYAHDVEESEVELDQFLREIHDEDFDISNRKGN